MAKKQKVFPAIGAGLPKKSGSVVLILSPATPKTAPTQGTAFRGTRGIDSTTFRGSSKSGGQQVGKK